METIANITQAKAFAAELGWTKADGERALRDANFPLDRVEALNLMVQFAGPELLNRQRLQGAQKAQVTKNRNKVEQLEQELVQTINTYEEKITRDRSNFIGVISYVYSMLSLFGYRDDWVEALIETYNSYLQNDSQDVA